MTPTTYRLEQLAVAFLTVIGGALWAVAFALRASARAAERSASAVAR
jgi:hypothetical protein